MNPNPENISEEQISSMLREKLAGHPIAQKARTSWVTISSFPGKCVSVSVMTENFNVIHGNGSSFDEAVADCNRQLDVAPQIAALFETIEELKTGKKKTEVAA